MLRVRRPGWDGLSRRASGRCSGAVVAKGRPELSCSRFTGQGGNGLSLCAGGGCSARVAAEGRLELSCGGFIGQRGTGCLTVPGVAARKGWSLWEGQSPHAALLAAMGRPVLPLWRWSLHGRSGP